MDYKLIKNSGIGRYNVFNPSPEEIEQFIDELIPVKYHFVILSSENKLNDYIQTLAESDGSEKEIKYLVEIHFEYGSKLGEDFKHYQYSTTNLSELKKMFRMYALDVLPDITEWKDITADIVALNDNKKG
jgi:hypothetical protein